MKVIFMGTPDFAVGTLMKLIESEHEVKAVVTQPDKPKGRGNTIQFTPVKEIAVKEGIPVYQPNKVRDPEFLKVLREIEADIIVVVAFGQIIPKTVLEMKTHGCVNVHASLLPKYRGAAPIQWAVINGEQESGVTTMQMDEGLDTGDILLKKVVKLEPEETGGSLFEKLSIAGAELLIDTLKGIEENTIVPTKQGDSPTEYAKMLKKDMGKINWEEDAETIERLIRGLNPWPSAYTYFLGKTLKIWKSEKEEGSTKETPGTIVEVGSDRICVQTGNGILSLLEIQLEGKKRMDTGAFLRGNHIEKGMSLCYQL